MPGGEKPVERIEWEYEVVRNMPGYTADMREALNVLGEQRWELVYIDKGTMSTTYIFKRPRRAKEVR